VTLRVWVCRPSVGGAPSLEALPDSPPTAERDDSPGEAEVAAEKTAWPGGDDEEEDEEEEGDEEDMAPLGEMNGESSRG
jgi:hypothetical protein